MKEFHTQILSIQVIDTKPGAQRTRCNFTEKAHAISARIPPEVFSDVPVLYPRIRIDLRGRACLEHCHSRRRDILNK